MFFCTEDSHPTVESCGNTRIDKSIGVCLCRDSGLTRRRNEVEEREKKKREKTRLPRQRVMRDASTSGVAGKSESDVPLACATTPSRSRRNDTDENYSCRNSTQEVTPQRRHPSGSTGRAITYTVHKASRCSQPVGWTCRRWLAEEVGDLARQYCRPGDTTHITGRPADLRLLMQGTIDT